MRFFVAMVSHETNTFSPIPTDRRQFEAHDLHYGGELLVPNLSFVASATAALDRRFGVALVDVDPDTLNVDPRALEAAIVPGRTRGIVPVHQFGAPADMSAIRAIASS